MTPPYNIKVVMELQVKDTCDIEEIRELIDDGLIENWIPHEHGSIVKWRVSKIEFQLSS